ncbi:MAG: RAMP superfamily CRISPR-associated protein [Streptosporangiaceae bacterium]
MAAERFSGVLDVTVTARTPLLIGGFTRDRADGTKETVLPHREAPEGAVMIPGSGLMGAARSVHEALAGGCMRVLNINWVPVHRHPADVSETRDLHLAVVTKVGEDGRAAEVALCDRWYWVPARLLPGDEDGPVGSGDQLQYVSEAGKPGEFPNKAITGPAGRRVVRGRSDAHPDGIRPGSIIRLRGMGPVTAACKIVLVTDTNARDPSRPVHFAVGQIAPNSARRTVPDGTWQKYLRTVEGADDLRPASLKKAGIADGEEPAWRTVPPEYAEVWWPPRQEDEPPDRELPEKERPQLIARRLRARSYLHVGQPVWVAVSGDEVTEVRLSLLWRYEGSGTVGERVGEAKGCIDPRHLCWSCRIFGSADTEGRDENDLAVQNSYRGHVRVDDLLAEGQVEPVWWDLAPLASPKPGAGQFYLDNSGRRQAADKNARPAATWGSVADEGGPRPVRGRKFYWRTQTRADPGSGTPQRGKYREHQSDALASKVALVPAGTVFTGRIAFDNLDAEDYGSLLAALDPRRLGALGEDGWGETVLSVGGGRPFGFGSVRIDVKPVRVQAAGERYLGGPADVKPATPEEAVRAFRDAVPAGVSANWQALRHALTFGFVDDKDVWYPPGGGVRGDQDYDKSFEFFALTNGLRLSEETRPMRSLPDAAAGKEQQILTSPAGQQRRAGRPQQPDRHHQGEREQPPRGRGPRGER